MTLEFFCFASGDVLSYSSRADWKGAEWYRDKLGSAGEGGCGAGRETPQLWGRYFFLSFLPWNKYFPLPPFSLFRCENRIEGWKVRNHTENQTDPPTTCFVAEGTSLAQTLTCWYFIVFVQTIKSHSVRVAAVQPRVLLVSHRTHTHSAWCVCVCMHVWVWWIYLPFLLFLQPNEVRGTGSPQGCCFSFEVAGVGGLIVLLKVNMMWI